MSNVAITVTLNQALPGGQYSVSSGTLADPNGTAPATTTVAANIATLVADGASPTQGHVNTLNTNWGTFLTAYNLYAAGVGTLTANATFMFDPAAITTMNQLRAALRKIEELCAGRLTA
jgi:hypothetical protein